VCSPDFDTKHGILSAVAPVSASDGEYQPMSASFHAPYGCEWAWASARYVKKVLQVIEI